MFNKFLAAAIPAVALIAYTSGRLGGKKPTKKTYKSARKLADEITAPDLKRAWKILFDPLPTYEEWRNIYPESPENFKTWLTWRAKADPDAIRTGIYSPFMSAEQKAAMIKSPLTAAQYEASSMKKIENLFERAKKAALWDVSSSNFRADMIDVFRQFKNPIDTMNFGRYWYDHHFITHPKFFIDYLRALPLKTQRLLLAYLNNDFREKLLKAL